MKLFSAFPSSQMNITDDTINAYVDATSAFSLDALRRSVEQFVTGRVERGNRSFVPSGEELAHNARQWQIAIDTISGDDAPLQHNGIIEMDFGQGRIDMRGLTASEQDQIISAKGRAPDGRSLAYLPLAEIRQAIAPPSVAQVDGKNFAMPRLGKIV